MRSRAAPSTESHIVVYACARCCVQCVLVHGFYQYFVLAGNDKWLGSRSRTSSCDCRKPTSDRFKNESCIESWTCQWKHTEFNSLWHLVSIRVADRIWHARGYRVPTTLHTACIVSRRVQNIFRSLSLYLSLPISLRCFRFFFFFGFWRSRNTFEWKNQLEPLSQFHSCIAYFINSLMQFTFAHTLRAFDERRENF